MSPRNAPPSACASATLSERFEERPVLDPAALVAVGGWPRRPSQPNREVGEDGGSASLSVLRVCLSWALMEDGGTSTAVDLALR